MREQQAWWPLMQEAYIAQVGKPYPDEPLVRPYIVLIADDFERRFMEMVDFYNVRHNLSVWLIKYRPAPGLKNGTGYKFAIALKPRRNRIRYERVPHRTFVCRIHEFGALRWNEILSTGKLPLAPESLSILREECKIRRVNLLVDVRRIGYVAKTFVARIPDKPKGGAIKVKWEYANNKELSNQDGVQ